jgi:hypothetical protein
MVEGRRSGSGARGRSGGAKRSGPSRGSRGAPAKPGAPPVAIALFIGLPLVAIIALGGYYVSKRRPPEEEPVTQIDPNAEINALRSQIDQLDKEAHQVIVGLRRGDEQLKKKVGSVRKKLEAWMTKWDESTKDLRTAEGWKPGYEGFGADRRRMNTVISDFNRESGFND